MNENTNVPPASDTPVTDASEDEETKIPKEEEKEEEATPAADKEGCCD